MQTKELIVTGRKERKANIIRAGRKPARMKQNDDSGCVITQNKRPPGDFQPAGTDWLCSE